MAKSKLKLLQEAITKGDLESAQKLANTLEKPKPKTKSKTKPKPKPKPRPYLKDEDESSYLAPSRPPGFQDEYGGRRFIGADGKEHIYGRRVSLEGVKFVNKFKPEGYKDLSEKEKKIEKQIKKYKAVPRPGQQGAQREPAKKVKIRCVICHDIVEVYPWEAETVDGESNFRCSKKSCVRAR